MVKNRKIFYFVLIVALAAIFYYEHHKLDSNLSHIENDLLVGKDKDGVATKANQSGITQIENPSNSASPTAEPSTPPSAPKNFPDWFAEEAKNLEASTKDPNEKSAQLKAQVQQLNPTEISFLRQKATDTKATANERISAAYLLTLSPFTESLSEVARAALSLPSPQPVHSIGETLLMQEKAIRVMAIDELFNRAKTDAALRNQLPSIIEKIRDGAVKQYALKRYQELK